MIPSADSSSPLHSPTRRPTHATFLTPLAVLLAFWFISSLLLGGELGKNTDDCSLNLRDPATGLVPSGVYPLAPYPYFFRPLHLAITFGVGTYFPTADRALHIASALAHLCACLALFFFAGCACRGWLAPLCATLVFMTLPVQSEVVLWFSTISTSIATGVFFALAALVLGYASGHPWISARGGPVCIFALALIVASLYEQPLAATPAIAVMALGASSTSRTRLIQRTGLGLGACLLAGAVYAALLLATSPPGTRGGAGSFIRLGSLGERLQELSTSIWYVVLGKHARDNLLGSLDVGWQTLISPHGVLAASITLAALATLLYWTITTSRDPAEHGTNQARDRRWIILGALLALLASWLPVLAIEHQLVQDRNLYLPLAMALLAAALGLDALLARLSRAPRVLVSLVLALITGAATLVGSVSHVGAQAVFKERSSRDRASLAQLAELLPNPPPGALFVPMRLDDLAARTGHIRFDDRPPSVMSTHWASTDELRRLFKRTDLSASGFARWTPPTLTNLTPLGTHISASAARTWTRVDPTQFFQWSRVIPFVIEPDGRVRLVRALVVERPDGADDRIPMPTVQSLLRQRPDLRPRTLVHRTCDLHLPTPPNQPVALKWHWARTNAPVAFPSLFAWSAQRECVWMHPAGEGGDRAEMRAEIPANTAPTRVVLRATVAEHDLANPEFAVPARLELSIEPPISELAPAALELSLEGVSRTRGWSTLSLPLPALPSGATLVLKASIPSSQSAFMAPGSPATPGTSSTPTAISLRAVAPVQVTPPLLFPRPAPSASPGGPKAPTTPAHEGDE